LHFTAIDKDGESFEFHIGESFEYHSGRFFEIYGGFFVHIVLNNLL
jgi:hypothetical protein